MRSSKDRYFEKRSELYGFLSLWIMLFHLNMFFRPLLGSIYLDRIASLGDSCVDIFLFVSGYCIYHSWKNDPDYWNFFKKRVYRIIPSYLLIAIPFFLWQDHLSFNFLYDLLGASFLIEGKLEAWFPIAIIFFYILSPGTIYTMQLKGSIWILVLGGLLIILLLNTVGYFSKTGIMWSRLPAYTLGIYCAMRKHEDGTDYLKKIDKNIILFIGCCVLLTVLAFSPILLSLQSQIGMDSTRVMYLFLIMPIISVITKIIRTLPRFIQSFLSVCGNVSLELYLIHLFLFYVISHYGMNVWLYPAALLVAIPLAYAVRAIGKLLS